MSNHNDGATDQLEEVSGRWLRDQLRDVAESAPPQPAGRAPASGDASSSQLIEGLAASISAAVVEPIKGLESRREARQARIEESLQELSGKLGEVFVEIGNLRDRAAEALAGVEETKNESRREIAALREQSRADVEALREQLKADLESARAQSKAEVEALGSEAKNEIEAIRESSRREINQINATASDLTSSFNSLAEEIGRLQEKVREQQERIDALRFRETQRAKAMNELAKASSSLREAVAAAAALAAPSEDPAGHQV